ncbi:MAG: hypothetical protein EAZ81_04935, partial [Verrucomicrobia bacterium]
MILVFGEGFGLSRKESCLISHDHTKKSSIFSGKNAGLIGFAKKITQKEAPPSTLFALLHGLGKPVIACWG